MAGWTKLFSSIIHSTIWREDNATRLVWVTMLAMANKNGIVETSIPGLADASRVDLEQCERALKKLEAPDPYSRSQDFEGRRIEPIDGGWLLLNHEKYRNKISEDRSREQAAERMRKMREKQKAEKRAKNIPDDFEQFWKAYPRKTGKQAALKAWQKAKGKPTIEKVITILEQQKQSSQWMKDNGQFIPLPTTWLNQGRWDDEIEDGEPEKPPVDPEYERASETFKLG